MFISPGPDRIGLDRRPNLSKETDWRSDRTEKGLNQTDLGQKNRAERQKIGGQPVPLGTTVPPRQARHGQPMPMGTTMPPIQSWLGVLDRSSV